MEPTTIAALSSIGKHILGGLGSESTTSSGQSTSSGTETSQQVLSPEAINQMINSVMSSDQGLASLSSGENLSGGFGSSTKTMQAQDLATKLIGELARITAPTVKTASQQSQQTSKTKKKKRPSIICTEAFRQRKIPRKMYEEGLAFYDTMWDVTLLGYWAWAEPMVKLMRKYKWLANFWAYVALKRYQLLLENKKSFTGYFAHYGLRGFSFCVGVIAIPFSKDDDESWQQ